MFLSLILSSFFTFVELNCENLFDTVHDSLKNDIEFLPESEYHWTRTRFWRKVNHISQEIISLGELGTSGPHRQLPDMIALCEVENDSVMIALTKRGLLRKAGYEYVMTSSPDERGINVALMYLPMSFRLIHSHSIRIERLTDTRPTRDVLYAKGILMSLWFMRRVEEEVNVCLALIVFMLPSDWRILSILSMHFMVVPIS